MKPLFDHLKQTALTIEGVKQVELLYEESDMETFPDRLYTFIGVQFGETTINNSGQVVDRINFVFEQAYFEESAYVDVMDRLLQQIRELKFLLTKTNDRWSFASEWNLTQFKYMSIDLSCGYVCSVDVIDNRAWNSCKV